MPTEPRLQALTTGRRVHLRLAQALRSRDPDAGAGCELPGLVRECLIRAACSDTYRALLVHGCHVEDAFDLYGYYTGVIDAWYEAAPNSAAVVDWKTGEANPAAHRVQRLLYALTLLAHYDSVRVTTVNIGPHPWSDVADTFVRQHAGQMRAALSQLVEDAPADAQPTAGPAHQQRTASPAAAESDA
jgi:hypothetical protein